MTTRNGRYYASEAFADYGESGRGSAFKYNRTDRPRAEKTKVTPPPPPNDDDAKVARHEEQAATDLRNALWAAGEGGWRSQWYTGMSEHLSYARQQPYTRWRAARDSWTVTGDSKYLKSMLAAVDFTNPPWEHEVKIPGPPPEKRSLWRRVLAGLLGVRLSATANGLEVSWPR